MDEERGKLRSYSMNLECGRRQGGFWWKSQPSSSFG